MQEYIKNIVKMTKSCIHEVKKAFAIGKTKEDLKEWFKFINGLAYVIALYLLCLLGRYMVDISPRPDLSMMRIGRFFLKNGATEANLGIEVHNIGLSILFVSMGLLFALVMTYLRATANKLNGNDDEDSK